jgi:hypothetical protein
MGRFTTRMLRYIYREAACQKQLHSYSGGLWVWKIHHNFDISIPPHLRPSSRELLWTWEGKWSRANMKRGPGTDKTLRLKRWGFHVTSCDLYNWATLFLGGINTGTWSSRVGESQMRHWNKVTGSERLGPLNDCTANCRPILSSKRAPHRNKTTTFRQKPSDRK